MTSVTDLDPDALSNLSERIDEVVVQYATHRMPAGTQPSTGRVGVERAGLGVVLRVERGYVYDGIDAEAADWLQTGSKHFPDVDEMVQWLNQVIPPAPQHLTQVVAHRPRPEIPPAAELTVLSEVGAAPFDRSVVSEAELSQRLTSRISGQDSAVYRLAAGVARQLGKTHPRKPYSACLMGDTGIGKTATVLLLAETLGERTGEEWRTIRLDGAEFAEALSISRLVGAAPNYVGYGDGNDLAARLAAHSYNVVLFDEIEKAHPSVVNALLGLLDTGTLRSERHGSVTAAKSLIFATTNLGSEALRGNVPSDEAARTHLRSHGLAPELVARFSDVVTYGPLDGRALAEVAAQSVAVVAADYGLTAVSISPAYLGGLLDRRAMSRLGVRIIEHLVDADLGQQFAALAAAGTTHMRITFSDVPLVEPVSDPSRALREGER